MDNAEIRKCISEGYHEQIRLLFRVYVQGVAMGDPDCLDRFVKGVSRSSECLEAALSRFQ